MRLRNPLQGVKIAHLNFLSHLIFYLVIVFAVVHEENTNDDLSNHEFAMQIEAVNLLKWGHLLCFLTQVICLSLKKLDDYNYIAQVLMVMFNFVFYFLPLLRALYVFKETDLNPLTLEVNNDYEGMI